MHNVVGLSGEFDCVRAVLQKKDDDLHAHASPQLGSILMNFGLLEWINRIYGIAWRHRESPAPTIDARRMVLSG